MTLFLNKQQYLSSTSNRTCRFQHAVRLLIHCSAIEKVSLWWTFPPGVFLDMAELPGQRHLLLFAVTAESLARMDRQLAVWNWTSAASCREVHSGIHQVKQVLFRKAPPSPDKTLVFMRGPSQALFLAVSLQLLLKSMGAAGTTWRSTDLKETGSVPGDKCPPFLPLATCK